MYRGFTVHTAYGYIEVGMEDAAPIAAAMRRLFEEKLKGRKK